ncbi:hypothetical protein KSF_004000 [Reticulibacter mediterranei]|uniref:Uncharacterized protein n=1 Tax=Reticulibacter mediterranei TaxID=2778369 RepID=A0A8J3MXZ3_9CHLR|nr:hypothetical protein [Reticulibacter mediterranei]GHO90352.1 hypothetical protein KSF_004000 [Reticulibacter mediterranei]
MPDFAQERQPQNSASTRVAQPDRATPEADASQHPLSRLQHTIGNQAVQRMIQTHKEDIVTIHWPEDEGEFFRRLVAALARSQGFRGVDSPFTAFYYSAIDFHRSYAPHIKAGQLIKVHVSAIYDPDDSNKPGFSHISVMLAETGTTQHAASAIQPETDTPGASQAASQQMTHSPQDTGVPTSANPTIDSTARMLADWVMSMYQHNVGSVRMTITYDGKIVLPTSEQAGNVQRQHEGGKVALSEARAFAAITRYINWLTMSGLPGEAEIELLLDNKPTLLRYQRRELSAKPAIRPAPIPRVVSRDSQDVKAIENEIRSKEKSLYNVGQSLLKQSDPFTLRNLPSLAAGIIIPAAVGYAIVNFDELGQLIQIQRFNDFGELLDVEVVAEQETLLDSEGAQAAPKLSPGPEPVELPAATSSTKAPVPGNTPESVWVQLKNGSIREYHPSEVQGDLAQGAEVSTAEGRGRVVSRGEPPHSRQVVHPRSLKPLLTPEELNEPVTLRKGLSGEMRRLTSEERDGAIKIRTILDRVRHGEPGAMQELAGLRPHELTGDLKGWYEVDLLPENPGALNQMRLLLRQGKDGDFEVRLLQMH